MRHVDTGLEINETRPSSSATFDREERLRLNRSVPDGLLLLLLMLRISIVSVLSNWGENNS